MPTWLDPPLTGVFPRLGPPWPPRVRLGERTFALARWQQDKPGVLAQYREEVEEGSMHMSVLHDGTYRVDHLDEHNPDWGPLSAVGHLARDYSPGRVAGVVVLGGLVVLGAAVFGAAVRRR